MKLINIVPVKNMPDFMNQPMNMFLTHLVLKNEEYRKMAQEYTGYKILDNSLIECGSAFSIEDVCKAADLIGADEIILPDVYKKASETISLVCSSIKWLKEHRTEAWLRNHKLMAVAQGDNPESWTRCFNTLASIKEISVIGIPKVVSNTIYSRDLFENAWLTHPRFRSKDLQIHLLGLYFNFKELKRYIRPDLIRSCDTCHLSYLAKNKMGLYETRPDGETIDLENDYVESYEYLYTDYNDLIKFLR